MLLIAVRLSQFFSSLLMHQPERVIERADLCDGSCATPSPHGVSIFVRAVDLTVRSPLRRVNILWQSRRLI